MEQKIDWCKQLYEQGYTQEAHEYYDRHIYQPEQLTIPYPDDITETALLMARQQVDTRAFTKKDAHESLLKWFGIEYTEWP